jgi:hypothetical protein
VAREGLESSRSIAQHALVVRELQEVSRKRKRGGGQIRFSGDQDRRSEPVEQGEASLV